MKRRIRVAIANANKETVRKVYRKLRSRLEVVIGADGCIAEKDSNADV